MKVNSRCQEAIQMSQAIQSEEQRLWFFDSKVMSNSFVSLETPIKNLLRIGDTGITEVSLVVEVWTQRYWWLYLSIRICPFKLQAEWGLHTVQEFWTKLSLVLPRPGHLLGNKTLSYHYSYIGSLFQQW